MIHQPSPRPPFDPLFAHQAAPQKWTAGKEVMKAKAQLEPRQLSSSPELALSEPHRNPPNGNQTVAIKTNSHEVLRNVDATWLFESAPDAKVLVSPQGRIVLVNGQTEKMFGYRREELVGEPVEKLMPERFRSAHVAHRFLYNAAPHTRSMGAGLDLFGQHRDGHEFPIEISLAPLETEDGVLISSAIRDVTDLKRTHELKSSLEFERLISELSAKFINLPADQVDGQIKEAQKRICEALDLDRNTLAQVSADTADVIVSHSWAREGFEPTPALSRRDFPWLSRTVLGGQRVSFARIDDLPYEAEIDKESFRRYGAKSNVIFPLSVGGKVVGALSFGSLRAEREWHTELLDRLGLLAQVFASALARARADDSLHQAYGEIKQLKSRLENENLYLREEVKLGHHHHEVIGNSQCIRRVLKQVEQAAPTDSTVLVLGETGTGKELIARAIHEQSRRKDRVMVKVNCAALPASLIESELFGREKGAFTGALTRGMGRFELANGSTILLDEVGELPFELQSKLLRVLQEGEFERLGSPKIIKVDVRVIAATSKNLQQSVREGKFREDLFYRLNVFPITIPPLRERREDIPPLVWHFVKDLSQKMGRSIETIQGSTMEAFKTHYWPGNVRELRNLIERFLITGTDTMFRAELPIVEARTASAHSQTVEEVERNHVLHILEVVSWRVRGEGGAAQVLGLKPSTLESRMQKLGIVRPK